MAIKLNEFVVQAKLESETDQAKPNDTSQPVIPASVRREIIDECLEKVKEYINRQIRDDRR